jgi:hypothetical protein
MPWGVVAGAAIGAVSSSVAASANRKAANKAAEEERRQADLQFSRSQPYQTSGVLGDVSFESDVDPETGLTTENRLKLNLSEPYQKEHDYLVGSPDRQRAYIERFAGDPEAASESYFQRHLERNRDQQGIRRESAENDLFRRGMLGSTGGFEQMRAVNEAEAQEDRLARFAADDRVQAEIDRYRSRGAVDFAASMGIEGALHQYANLGMGAGSQAAQVAGKYAEGYTNAANTTAQAAINSNNAIAAGISSVGGALGAGYAKGFGSGNPGSWGGLGQTTKAPSGGGGGFQTGNYGNAFGAASKGWAL